MSEIVDPQLLVHLVRESCEIDSVVSPGRIVGQWLEIFEEGEDEEGHGTFYAYWVRLNPKAVARYDMVEVDTTYPDAMDLNLAHLIQTEDGKGKK